jgi:hypothetical protein
MLLLSLLPPMLPALLLGRCSKPSAPPKLAWMLRLGSEA